MALFTRFEPVQFLLAGMLKGKLYSYSPHMEDGMKERNQDVVLSSAAPPELQYANNNMLDVKIPASLNLWVKNLILTAVHGTVTCGPWLMVDWNSS